MLGFLVRTAVRTAIRSQQESRAAQEELAEWYQAQANSPFALVHDAAGESALFEDRRSGFTHSLPGYPRAVGVIPALGEPPADVVLAIGDLPVTVRYWLDRPQFQASDAVDYAVKSGQGYAGTRTGGQPPVVPARPDQVALWSVDAAAVASYALPRPDPYGADFEDLVMLVRQATAMAVTFRYPRGMLDWLRQAFFFSAARAGMSWNPHRERGAPRLWPESAFLLPTVNAELNQHKLQVLQQITPALWALSQPEKEAVSVCLGAMVQREEPPWAPAAPDVIASHAEALFGCSVSPAYRQIVHQAMSEVRTMHDLRGVSVLLGRAMSG